MTSGQQPRKRREQDPVPVVQIRPVDLTAQHRDLMPKHHDLEFLRAAAATGQHHQLEEPTK
jgi:hypothetical protein